MNPSRHLFVGACVATLSWTIPGPVAMSEEKDPPKKEPKPPAGKADLLRHVKKSFARFVDAEVSLSSPKVRIEMEGENEVTEWAVLPDAEIKIHGWWGRLGQLVPNDRVWVWFSMTRDKKPSNILMIADEISAQDIHAELYAVKVATNETLVLHFPEEPEIPERSLQRKDGIRGALKERDKVLVQTAGENVRLAMSPVHFEELRKAQKEYLRDRWREDGLPGVVSFLHSLGGEMDLILDHEAIRWGRYLSEGDKVTINLKNPILATVKSVTPWRERTQLRLVAKTGLDLQDLANGQRVSLLVPDPPEAMQRSNLPMDIGRRNGKSDRIDWFLSTIYCSCGIGGDRCTGMFYVQASCNVNGCGMPNEMRSFIGQQIDRGLTDEQIFDGLRAEKGTDVWRPHLLR
jgi:hypothetical protein